MNKYTELAIKKLKKHLTKDQILELDKCEMNIYTDKEPWHKHIPPSKILGALFYWGLSPQGSMYWSKVESELIKKGL